MILENKENFYVKVFEKNYSIKSKNFNMSNVQKILINFCHLQDLIQKNVDELATVFGQTLKAQKINQFKKGDFKYKKKDNNFKENLEGGLLLNKTKSSKTQPQLNSKKEKIKKIIKKTSFSEFLKEKDLKFEKRNFKEKIKKKYSPEKKKRVVGLKYEEKRHLEGISCFECINVKIKSFIML